MPRPAPPRISVVVPTDDFSSPEKMEEVLPEQSLLMAALNGADVRHLRDKITYPNDERRENVYYVDLVDYISEGDSCTYDMPTEVNFVSGANKVLGEINKFIIAAPGSLKESGSEGIEKEPVKFFNYLHTSTISSMTPRAELALAIRDLDGGLVQTVPFIFSNANRSSDIDNMLNERYERGFGVALESITVTSDAQDPALSKFVTCDITVRMASAKYLDQYVNNTYELDKQARDIKKLYIEDLFYTSKHESQAYSLSTPWRKEKTHNAEIMLTLGYAAPNEALLPKNSKERKEIEDNLHNMTQKFFLKPTDYDIIAEQTGQVVLTLKYASSFDADMDSKSRKSVPSTPSEKKTAAKSGIIGALKDQVVKYKQEKGDTLDYSEVDRFISYAKQAISVSALKAREVRTRQIIDRITQRGQKTLVLPYTISRLDRHIPPDPQVVGNAEVDTSSQQPSVIVDYDFATPTTRGEFLTRNKQQNLNTNELRAIEFVLFGEIIDYVFEEFFSTSGDPNNPLFAKSKAAIFSAFSFGIYDSNYKTKVDKIYGMRDAPVSLDILWDMLINSPITEANGGFPKARYYKDLVSNIYSKIYKSCDKAINLLMGEATFESSSHTLRKLGVPEINAHEIYLPKSCLDRLAETRKEKRGYIDKGDVNNTLMLAIKNDNKGSQISDKSPLEDYCLVLFFTSHIPFSPTDSSRGIDYHFASFGQYGIVKGFSYSPVEVPGLLESAIASRTAGGTPGGVDGQDRFYKSLLKVDISTFGFPVVTPGMTVEVSEVLLGLQPGSKMSNSITNSYFVTRVQTTMNKGDYTTTIEGYPNLKPSSGDDEEAPRAPNPTLLGNKDFILETMLKSYNGYLVSSRGDSVERPVDLVKKFINDRFFGTYTGDYGTGMIRFFPELMPKFNGENISRKIFLEDYGRGKAWNPDVETTEAPHWYGPGKFGYLKDKSESKEINYLNYMRLTAEVWDYPASSIKCYDAANDCYKKFQKENRKSLDSLFENLKVTKDSYFPHLPQGIVDPFYLDLEMLRLAAYRIVNAVDETYVFRNQISTNIESSPDDVIVFNDYAVACRTFMEIMNSCSAIWRSKLEEISEFMDETRKAQVLTALKDGSPSPDIYGVTSPSMAEMEDITKKITDEVQKRDHDKIMKTLREDLQSIISAELRI